MKKELCPLYVQERQSKSVTFYTEDICRLCRWDLGLAATDALIVHSRKTVPPAQPPDILLVSPVVRGECVICGGGGKPCMGQYVASRVHTLLTGVY
jgi:hypothetical protein